jgi:hypothetical protein
MRTKIGVAAPPSEYTRQASFYSRFWRPDFRSHDRRWARLYGENRGGIFEPYTAVGGSRW